MIPEKENEFTCHRCKETFEMGWSKEEAEKECIDKFGRLPADEDMLLVCDDCYREITAFLN